MVRRIIATTLGLQVFVLFLNFNNVFLLNQTLPSELNWVLFTLLLVLVGVMGYICAGYLRLQKKIAN